MSTQKHHFPHSKTQLQEMSALMLAHAQQIGATDASVEISEGDGLHVSVRCAKTEKIEHTQSKSAGVTVYLGKQQGYASTSNFSVQALKETVEAALNIAKYTAIDDCAGLAEAELLETSIQDLDLFHPWDISVDEALAIALQTEQAAFDFHSLIKNSEGASISTHHSQFILATSNGFSGGYPSSLHTIACVPIAGEGSNMQVDSWYSSKVSAMDLSSAQEIGAYAAQRALSSLNARSLPTCKVPVLFEAPLAAGLIGTLVRALSGGALYQQISFLKESLGQTIFPQHISLLEDPFVLKGRGSSPFDSEGVRVKKRKVIDQGIVQGYFLSSYSARKLGMQTTGNAGGSHNLYLHSNLTQAKDDLAHMLKKMDKGLLITRLIGDGVNYVTGDYSRGASGFWVENGEIQYPVEEITIAGNLKEMFKQIVAIGADRYIYGSKETGSILIESMTVAGKSSS